MKKTKEYVFTDRLLIELLARFWYWEMSRDWQRKDIGSYQREKAKEFLKEMRK